MKRLLLASVMGFLMINQACAAQTGPVEQIPKNIVDSGNSYISAFCGASLFVAAGIGGLLTAKPMDDVARQQFFAARDIFADSPSTWNVAGAVLTIPLAVGCVLCFLSSVCE